MVVHRLHEQGLQVMRRDVGGGLPEGGAEQTAVEIREWRSDQLRPAQKELSVYLERQQEGDLTVQTTFDDGKRMVVRLNPGPTPVIALVQ